MEDSSFKCVLSKFSHTFWTFHFLAVSISLLLKAKIKISVKYDERIPANSEVICLCLTSSDSFISANFLIYLANKKSRLREEEKQIWHERTLKSSGRCK